MRRKILSRIPAIAVLLLLCIITVIYVDGWFDISFIVRGDASGDGNETDIPEETVTSPAEDVTTHDPDGNANGTETPGTSVAPVPDTDDVPASPVVEIPDISALPDGYSLSYAEWVPDAGWKLAETSLDNAPLPAYFSSHETVKYDVSYVSSGDNTMYEAVYTPITVDETAITLYMGYIIVETETPGVVNIYSQSGAPLGSYKTSGTAPAFCRDKEGRPLFTHSGAYYYLDAESGSFVLSDYDPALDLRGALFDYTPDYGVSDAKDRQFISKATLVEVKDPVDGTVIETNKYTFALANENGKRLTGYKYSEAYGFSGSLAAVVDSEGHLSYISPDGDTEINTSRVYVDTANLGRKVIEFFMEPITNGAESIGYYFFEHGLVRARVLSLDYSPYNWGEIRVFDDEDVVITANGERFYIPPGYDVNAYSCGMLLLSGDGKRGFMNYTGAWIVDPDLDGAEPFYEGLAVVKKDGDVALIDTEGNIVLPYGQFSYISNASSGVIAAYDGEWHVFYKMERS